MTFNGLISPKTGEPLQEKNDSLTTSDKKENYLIVNDIAYLLDQNSLSELQHYETEIFDNMKIRNVPYFREELFGFVAEKVIPRLKGKCKTVSRLAIAEMGAGEGHWARYVKKKFPRDEIFVCDLSLKTLERAPGSLRRVCADITGGIFEKESLDLVSFWVSLHHLDVSGIFQALKNAIKALKKDGILLIFEPNAKFLPRHIMYNTKLARDVYPDEKEKAIDFSKIRKITGDMDMIEEDIRFLNPPYNPEFVKKLKKWHLYMAVVELLYGIDKFAVSPILNKLFPETEQKLKEHLSLYGMAIFRKNTD